MREKKMHLFFQLTANFGIQIHDSINFWEISKYFM